MGQYKIEERRSRLHIANHYLRPVGIHQWVKQKGLGDMGCVFLKDAWWILCQSSNLSVSHFLDLHNGNINTTLHCYYEHLGMIDMHVLKNIIGLNDSSLSLVNIGVSGRLNGITNVLFLKKVNVKYVLTSFSSLLCTAY